MYTKPRRPSHDVMKVLFIIFFLLINQSYEQDNPGTPPGICDSLPVYGENSPSQYKLRPWTLQVNQGRNLNISMSSPSSIPLLYYWVQARSVESNRILGIWSPVQYLAKTYRCDAEADTITNAHRLGIANIVFMWTAPRDFRGSVIIKATIFDNNRRTWTGVDSPVIKVIGNNVGTTEVNTVSSGTNSNQKTCGKAIQQAVPLIVSGEIAQKGQWPWHVAIYHYKTVDSKYICGGTLISSWHVLTAAHCVTERSSEFTINPETLIIYLGKFNLRRTSEDVQTKLVRSIFIHPQYNHSNLYGDLAILKFTKLSVFSDVVRPVCVWKDSTDLANVVGKLGVVVGWGKDEDNILKEELYMVRMPVVDQLTCLRSYPDFFIHFTSDQSYCAGYANGSSVCSGDSGGGMFFSERSNSGDTWYLRGMVSLSATTKNSLMCDTYHYAVFTDVAKYLRWIRENIVK